MKNIFAENKLSFIFRAAAIVLTVIPVVYVIGHMAAVPEYKRTLLFIPLAVLAEILTVVFSQKSWNDFLHVAGSVFAALAFASFMSGGVLSIADYIAGINLFGDSTQVPAIIAFGAMLFLGMAFAIADCFICTDSSPVAENQINQ